MSTGGLRFQLPDVLARTAPPEMILGVSVIGDTAFLAIETVDETPKTTTTTEVAEIAVDLLALVDALDVIVGDSRRDRFRKKDECSYIGADGVIQESMVRRSVIS